MPHLSNLGDPIFLGIMVALVVFVIFIYLMLRRTILGFREGFNRGQS